MTDKLQGQLDRVWSVVWRSEFRDKYSQYTLSEMWTGINCEGHREGHSLRHGHVQVLERRIVYDYLIKADLESVSLWTRAWQAKRVLCYKPVPFRVRWRIGVPTSAWSFDGCKTEFERDLTLLMLGINLDKLPEELPRQGRDATTLFI